MKTPLLALAAITIFVCFGTSYGQSHANANAPANANMVCGITILNQSNLYFGTVISGAGTAHVDNTSTETYTGSIDPGTHGGTHAAAQFLVTGQSGYDYGVDVSPSNGLLTVTDGLGHSASVQLDPPIAQSGTPGTLSDCSTGTEHGDDGHGGTIGNGGEDNGKRPHDVTPGGCCGTQTFNVGGVLTTTTGQFPGSYSNANSGGTTWLEIVTYN